MAAAPVPIPVLIAADPKQVDLAAFSSHLRESAGLPLDIIPVPGGPAAVREALLARRGGTPVVVVDPAVGMATKDWLPLFLDRLKADPALGLVAPKIYDRVGLILSCGRTVVSALGPRDHFANIGYGESEADRFARFTEVDAVLPWLFVIRPEALAALAATPDPIGAALAGCSAPDATPFSLFGDDLCLSVRAAGFTVAVDPAVLVVNIHRNTFDELNRLQVPGTVPDLDERTINLWKKKWRWNPSHPDLHAVRARWGETPICWRIGKTLLDDWKGLDHPAVDLLMVTRNNIPLLEKTLASLAATTYPDRHLVRLFVLLNGDTAGSRARIEAFGKQGSAHSFPFRIEIIETPVNLGFPAAFNWLLSASDAPLVAKLDDDIEIQPDWLTRMVDRLREHLYAGVVGGKVLNHDDPETIQWADYRLWPGGSNNQGTKDTGQHNHLTRTIANMGCCLLYRRKAFDKAGGIDVALSPGSWDDLDHQIALRAAGYDVLFDGHIAIRHPFKRLRDHCRRTRGNMMGNGTKVNLKWGVGAFQVIDRGLDEAGRLIP
ncbi:Glycosyltransferase, GT2 family [Verrucomicrobium sp. GAS474]|uniref:glycosyltransferase n=1 Tax=Verrucomicrobium sp. GAS474 TaxID=1882831 RepID=UPI0008798976|nr:glycosyltransferase [Verrucomicrobium sp. GAS474]SDU21300.1 Glycosyltransferase, GT2 family [Verrucomicrobium sp. GAS474]